MGTDIHIIAETKTKDSPIWQKAPNILSSDRAYNTFAIIADVRNGAGFAGIKTGDGYNPIAKPRGIAKDSSLKYLKEFGEGKGFHSHSWLTMMDILDYDWMQTTKLCGEMDLKQYLHWRRCIEWRSQPEEYCGECSGPGIVHVDMSEMEKIRARNKDEAWDERALHSRFSAADGKLMVRCEWPVSYYESAKQLWFNWMPQLISLARKNNLASTAVRIQFCFDS